MQNVEQTIVSQYQNSPTLVQLVQNINTYLDPLANLEAFFDFVWNVDTAQGFGLDTWGKIVDVGRFLIIDATPTALDDDAYRTLILAKAMSNITATNSASLNQLLANLFPGRGRAYVNDLGAMAMRYVFEFDLTPTEYAILTQTSVLPHPAGVEVSILVIPGPVFGFSEAAGLPIAPFDEGIYQS